MNRLLPLVLTAALSLTACSTPDLRPTGGLSAAAGATLTASVDEPLPGEAVTLSGSTGVSGRRTVSLQQFVDGGWVASDDEPVRSAASGRFSFDDLTVERTAIYRAITGSDDPIVTNAVELAPAPNRQRATVRTLPLVAGEATTETGEPSDGASVVQAEFDPARPGREVVFEARGTDGRWREQGRSEQNPDGHASLVVPRADGFDRWRATASAYRGLEPSRDVSSTIRWNESFASDFASRGRAPEWADRLAMQWLPNRTCSFVTSDAVDYPGGVARLMTSPLTRLPRSMREGAPGDQVHQRICRDAAGQARYYRSSMIVSRAGDGLFTFVHGVAAARIRFDRRAGQHAAFWLQTNQPNDTEIDVVESNGQGNRSLTSGLHVTEDADSLKSFQKVVADLVPGGADDAWYDRFHTFSVEWTPDAYVFRVDGVEVHRTTEGLSDAPHYVILSNFVADWEVAKNSGETATMEVDWVRVWQDPADSTSEERVEQDADVPTSALDADSPAG